MKHDGEQSPCRLHEPLVVPGPAARNERVTTRLPTASGRAWELKRGPVTTWRTVRVFISSTFRDMHAERDHLVKVVFPALRERLAPDRGHLLDVDLRWGVTKEQAENDRVIDLCLKQIDECRPFFIGILGQR